MLLAFGFDAFNFKLDDFSVKNFDQRILWIGDRSSVSSLYKFKIKINVGNDAIIVSILSAETSCSSSLVL